MMSSRMVLYEVIGTVQDCCLTASLAIRTTSCAVVRDNWCWWLRMPEFVQDATYGILLFAIVK